MESQQAPNEQEGGSGMSGKSGTNYVCRQSSSRWTPTTDQIRILKELYYNNGVRSPNADQIQKISARLRQYGKIEGKNVFYWFQNHKARERQKKRFTNTNTADIPIIYNKYHIIRSTPGAPSPSSSCSTSSSPAMFSVGQMGSYGYGSVIMEKGFGGHNFWVGGGSTDHHPYSLSYPFFDQRTNTIEDDEQEEEQHEIQTLPLFPIHADNVKQMPLEVPNSCYYSGSRSSWYQYSDLHSNCNGYSYGSAYGGSATARTSLELSLNSYTGIGSSN